jgi:hypothetical protein
VTSRTARRLLAAGALAFAAALSVRAAGAGAETTGAEMAFTPPARLSETGLYADAGALAVDPRNRPFTPQYPLWTDGAAKRRWVRLPDGAAIDTRDLNHWDFPVGTRFWKEFAFGGRRVETRLLVKTGADGWEFATYVWNADQRDAVLAPPDGVPQVAEVAPGKYHHVPSREECRACHDSGRTEILGFTALQLSTDRDPLAPHAEPLTDDMVTLATLVAEDRLRPARLEWLTAPPRIAARDPRERAVLGYLSSNCGSCHNPRSSIASVGLFLQHEADRPATCAPDAIATTVGRPGHWVVPTALPGTSQLVHAGRPELSALLYRAKSRRPSSQMPPLGSAIADQRALALLTEWIAAGPGAGAAACATAPQTR